MLFYVVSTFSMDPLTGLFQFVWQWALFWVIPLRMLALFVALARMEQMTTFTWDHNLRSALHLFLSGYFGVVYFVGISKTLANIPENLETPKSPACHQEGYQCSQCMKQQN